MCALGFHAVLKKKSRLDTPDGWSNVAQKTGVHLRQEGPTSTNGHNKGFVCPITGRERLSVLFFWNLT